MNKLSLNTASLIAGLMIAVVPATAGGTLYWELQGQQAYLRGEVHGLSISREGRLTLAPKFEEVFDTGQTFVWSSAVDRQGIVYLGTGHEGKIFRVERSGSGQLILDTDELDVTALAVDDDGTIYAGTSPNGKVYRITPQGQSSVFFDPEDTYIWSMTLSSDTLFIGTGAKGRIYKVDKAGNGQVLVDTKETNIMTMVAHTGGDLIVGTDPSGLILRINQLGKQFAIYDSPSREIHDLAIANDGTIYALGLSERGGTQQGTSAQPSGQPSTVTATSSTGNVTVTITSLDLSPQTPPSESQTQSFSSVLYRVNPSGAVDTVWTASNFSAFCIALDPERGVLVGTSDKGRIYSVDQKGSQTLLIQSSEGQISTFAIKGPQMLATTSNLGKLFRLGPEATETGTFESQVFDTQFISQWGTVTWRNQVGPVEVQTRTGNTDTIDETWSDWSAPCSNGGKIQSPPARFIQIRLTLKRSRSDTVISQIEGPRIAYLPQNLKPTIATLEVLQTGIALQEVPQQPIDPGILSSGLDPSLFGLTTNVPPRRVYQRGARSLQWSASDPNGDQLVYSIYYRSITENRWNLLTSNLTGNYYTLDAETLPDGRYFFRLVASDSPSNPAERAREDERITDVVQIDNTPPTIRASQPKISGRRVEIDFAAEDATSNLSRAEVSIDGGRWQLVFPADGMADSLSEQFTVKFDFTSPGEHTITLRVYDSNTNVGSSKVTVSVP